MIWIAARVLLAITPTYRYLTRALIQRQSRPGTPGRRPTLPGQP